MKLLWTQQLIRSKPIVAMGIALVATLLFTLIRQAGWLQEIELATFDRYQQWRPVETQWDSPIVLIKIYEEDIQRYHHPLSDRLLAQILKKLLALEPSAIGVDIFRDLPSEGRDELSSVITNNPNIVMIEKLLRNRIAPPEFVERSSQIGFADLKLDPNGIVRRALLFLWDENSRVHISFSLQLALTYLREIGITLTRDPTNHNHVRLNNTTIERFRSNQGGYINVDDGGYQFLLDYHRGTHPFPSFSISQVLDGTLDAKAIQGRIVILGTASTSVSDVYETALSTGGSIAEPMHGMEIHGHAVDQLIRTAIKGDAPIRTFSNLAETLWILLWSLIGAALGIWLWSPWLLVLSAAGFILPSAAGYLMFLECLWIPAAPAAFAYISAFGIAIAYVSQREHAERTLIMQLFGRYVSRAVAKVLWAQRDQFMEDGRPRPQELIATIMITDLYGYTLPAETMAPARVMEWINSYIDTMTRIAEEHGGIVDDFAGDGIKVNFGVPLPRTSEAEIDQDARQAVQCALAMGAALSNLNEQWREQDYPTERLRIGIMTGPVIAGSVGSAQRMSYTTVGDTVNTAARLESFDKARFKVDLASEYRILIGESTWKRLGPGYSSEYLGSHRLQGRNGLVSIYRVQDDSAQNIEVREVEKL